MFSADDAVTTSQLTSSSLHHPFSGRMERKSDLILSTCIVGMQRFGSDVVLISGAAETERQTREQRTENGPRLASLFGHRWSRLPKGRFRWKQAIGTRQAVGIHIPIHNSSRADRNRHPMPPEDQNYAVYFRPFPQPGISAVFSTSWQLPSSRFWGSSGINPWHGRQASRLLPSTVSPREAKRQFLAASTIPVHVSKERAVFEPRPVSVGMCCVSQQLEARNRLGMS